MDACTRKAQEGTVEGYGCVWMGGPFIRGGLKTRHHSVESVPSPLIFGVAMLNTLCICVVMVIMAQWKFPGGW